MQNICRFDKNLHYLEKNGKRIQLNHNILQIPNEYYAPIRPKQGINDDESIIDILLGNLLGPVSEQVEEKLRRVRKRLDDGLYLINTILKMINGS